MAVYAYLRCAAKGCESTSFNVVVKYEPGDPPRRYECKRCGNTSVELGPEAPAP